MNLLAVRFRKAHVREHVGLGPIEHGSKLRELVAQLIGDDAPLADRSIKVLLGEDRVDHRQHHLPLPFAGVRERIAQEVDLAALPRRLQDLRHGGFEPLVRVGDHKLHAAQPSAHQRAQERGPERFGLRRTCNIVKKLGLDDSKISLYRFAKDNGVI